MHELDSARIKLQNASRHLERLDREIWAFLNSQPHSVHEVDNGEGPGRRFRFAVANAPNWEWSAIVGDFAHNLRSCLDHIAFGLALPQSRSQHPRSIYFPIYTASYYNRDAIQNQLRHMRSDAHEVIKRFQPWNGGENHLLWYLHEMNRIDKHRALVPVATALAIFVNGRRVPVNDVLIVDGQELVIQDIGPIKEQKLSLGAEVCFDAEGAPGLLRGAHFRGMYEYVSSTVIPAFEPFFK